MPSLGADMEAGTLVEWLKKPGESVKRGDVVAVVETQKGAIEVEVFEDGILDQLLVEPGVKVPVGTPLALIRKPGETPGALPVGPAQHAVAPITRPVPTPAPVARAPEPPAGPRLRLSPAAAARAASLGIDPRGLHGTGPGGAITLHDVDSSRLPKPAPHERPAPSMSPALAMRSAIGAAMARS